MVIEFNMKDKTQYTEWHINKDKQMMNKEDHRDSRERNKENKRVRSNRVQKEEKDDYQGLQLDIKSEKCLTQA